MKNNLFKLMVLGKLDIQIQKNEVGSLNHIQKLIQNRLRTKTMKLLEE